jgi:hypothetical protein
VHAAVSPGGVLPGQPQDEVADFLAGLRSAGLTRVAPLVPDLATVPGQQCSWRDQAVARSPAGSSRASAARMARSAQSGMGRDTWRRRTANSWRRARISASLAAWPRLSRYSQPKTRMMVRYRSRIGTVRDLASSRSARQTAGHGLCVEFWSGTGLGRPAARTGTCLPGWPWVSRAGTGLRRWPGHSFKRRPSWALP